jgi:glyoxylase-like metal-dependent hydrolase (beta-lactamase superfamily II)
MTFTIISIGALAANPLWGEKTPVRTGHATTTLVRAGRAAILVDPGLPAPALLARLTERTSVRPSHITHVFLTSFHPECRRALPAFEHAEWLIHDPEREAIGTRLATQFRDLVRVQSAEDEGDDPEGLGDTLRAQLEEDIAILQRCRPAPDRLAEGVSLFPLPGVTPGLCGLILERLGSTVLITGDAVATAEHVEKQQVLPTVWDGGQAKASFAEALEIADLIIPGRDNVLVNPVRRPV